MSTYHSRLCLKLLSKDAGEKWKRLESLAAQRNRTNPLLIARMFAVVMNERKSLFNLSDAKSLCSPSMNGDSIREIFPTDTESDFFEKDSSVAEAEVIELDSEDLGVFSWFSCHPQVSENDDEYFSLIHDVLLHSQDDSSKSAQLLQQVGSIVSLYNYRILEAMIMRNAQEVHPVSDFVLFLHSLSKDTQKKVTQSVGCQDLDDLMSQDWVQNLTVRGSTMLRLGVICLRESENVCSLICFQGIA